MKKLLIAAILLLSMPAFAGNILEDMRSCTYYASKATEYTMLAQASEGDFKSYNLIIADDINQAYTAKDRKWLAIAGEAGWKAQKDAPASVAMAVYQVCLKDGGKTT